MRAIAKWIKRSKRFPSLWPSLLTGPTMLEVVLSHLRKEHLKSNMNKTVASQALQRTNRDEILSEVKQSKLFVRKAMKAFGYSRERVVEALGCSLSPYFLLTEQSYIFRVESLSGNERRIAQELARNGALLEAVVDIKGEA